MEETYLSIVATSRNDNHGGDMLQRMSAFLNSVFVLSEEYKLPVEVIIVEWNPPTGKPYLHEKLEKPNHDYAKLKYVIVPQEIHNKYKSSSKIPLYQMIAKNVGIQRASGKFILCTNIDIIFSKENFAFLAKKELKSGFFYRANRVDINKEVMQFNSLDEQLIFAQKKENVIKIMGKTQGHESLSLPNFFYHFPNLCRLLNWSLVSIWRKTHQNQFPHFTIDFDACGDYTMMSKDDWEKIQGYVELDMYSIHIDSMALWSAVAVGLKQYILPFEAPVYHIDHEDGWESKDAIRTIKFLESKPCLDYSIVHRAGLQIIDEKRTWNINDENWGMKNITLEEFNF